MGVIAHWEQYAQYLTNFFGGRKVLTLLGETGAHQAEVDWVRGTLGTMV